MVDDSPSVGPLMSFRSACERYDLWNVLLDSPALRLLYAGGIAAIANERYDTLASLLLAPHSRYGTTTSVVQALSPARLNADNWAQQLYPGRNLFTPLSEHLLATLKPAFASLLIDETTYESAFDDFESLRCLVNHDLNGTYGGSSGRFVWKRQNWAGDSAAMPFDRIKIQAEAAGSEWSPLKAGLFSGSLERFLTVEASYRATLRI